MNEEQEQLQAHEVYAVSRDGTELHWKSKIPPGSLGPWPACLVIHGGGFADGAPGNMNTAADMAAAGFLALAIEYHLAPPASDMPHQIKPGYYPLQTDDVRLAILAARNDERSDGNVVAVGGSAGGSHGAYWCTTGEKGEDKLDALVSLSGNYDFSETASLNDPRRANFRQNVTNYVNTDNIVSLRDASPIRRVAKDAAPMLLYSTQEDTMPPAQFYVFTEALRACGASYGAQMIVETPQQDGFTRHSFKYWPDVRSDAISFLKQQIK